MMIYKFGKADTTGDPANLPVIDLFARGGLWLFLVRWHPGEVAAVFTYLFGGHYNVLLSTMSFASQLGELHVIALVISLAYHGSRCHQGPHLAILHEVCTLLGVFWKLPPNLSMVVYIVFFHLNHCLLALMPSMFKNNVEEQMPQKRGTNTRMGIAMVMITLFCTMEEFKVDVLDSERTFGSTLVDVTFIWLSSTTMLHVLSTYVSSHLDQGSMHIRRD